MSDQLVSLDAVRAARDRLRPYIARTPLIRTASGVDLKAESLHPIGAFKLRGAFNALLTLSAEERSAGVVAPSSGNHAQAVAYAAARLSVRATVVMPENSPQMKRDGCRRWGAEVVIHGKTSSESAALAEQMARERGLIQIPPFESARIIEATGSIALEVLEDSPDVEMIYVPVSGGGLISGIAAAAKAVKPAIRIVGVEPELANDAQLSWRAGERIGLTSEETARTIADGLRVNMVGELTWAHMRAFVDDVVTVSEDEIRRAVRWTASEARLIAEPSGATATAAALREQKPNVAAILSGGNVDRRIYAKLLSEED